MVVIFFFAGGRGGGGWGVEVLRFGAAWACGREIVPKAEANLVGTFLGVPC